MSDIIAFIGVGNMGNPMATNLHKAGYKIKVFDISTEMLIKAKENGLEIEVGNSKIRHLWLTPRTQKHRITQMLQ